MVHKIINIMTKKAQLEKMVYYYDHRGDDNKFVTADFREYVFDGTATREECIKQFKKAIYGPAKKSFHNGVTMSALFLREMEKYRGNLAELLEEKNRKSFFEILKKSINAIPYRPTHPDFCLDYSSFEWACMTVPRAWLR